MVAVLADHPQWPAASLTYFNTPYGHDMEIITRV
jgi:hypothetical protein